MEHGVTERALADELAVAAAARVVRDALVVVGAVNAPVLLRLERHRAEEALDVLGGVMVAVVRRHGAVVEQHHHVADGAAHEQRALEVQALLREVLQEGRPRRAHRLTALGTHVRCLLVVHAQVRFHAAVVAHQLRADVALPVSDGRVLGAFQMRHVSAHILKASVTFVARNLQFAGFADFCIVRQQVPIKHGCCADRAAADLAGCPCLKILRWLYSDSGRDATCRCFYWL